MKKSKKLKSFEYPKRYNVELRITKIKKGKPVITIQEEYDYYCKIKK